jgi:flagellar assembly protein FliH
VTGGVGDALAAWHAERTQALTRDEAAQRREELAAAEEAGYRRGLADGRTATEADGLELLSSLPGLVGAAAAAADAAVAAVVDTAAQDMVAAALEIARWAVGQQVSADPELLLDVACNALREAGGIAGAQVYVSPDLFEASERWSSRFGVERPNVISDPSLGPASVRVRSASGGLAEVSVAALVARAAESLGVPEATAVQEQS